MEGNDNNIFIDFYPQTEFLTLFIHLSIYLFTHSTLLQ